MEKTIQELEYEFYSKKYYLSYSALNKLLYSPMHFYKHYVLQQKEEKQEDYLIEGKVIHALMLGADTFSEQFVVSPSNLPGDNVKLVIDKLFNYITKELKVTDLNNIYLMDYEEKVIEILKEINLYQSFVDDKKTGETGDEKRFKKVAVNESVSYFDFLKSKGNKLLIDQTTLDKCLLASSALLSNSEVYSLMGYDSEMRNIKIFNEFPIISDMDDLYPFGFKGIVDNLVIDYDRRTIYINDLKTSSKTIAEFKDTIEFYKYWIQASIYYLLIQNHCKNLEGSWKIVFNFIVIDKYNQIYCFEVSQATMLSWNLELFKKVDEFKYHYDNKSYTLPYEFLTKKVVL